MENQKVSEVRDQYYKQIEMNKLGYVQQMVGLQNELGIKMEEIQTYEGQLDEIRNQFIAYRDTKSAEVSRLNKAIDDSRNKDQSSIHKDQRALEMARMSMQSEVLAVKSACEVSLQFAEQR